MKAKWFLVLIVALLLAALPASALAGAPAEVKVFVRNQTGGEVSLSITDADGNPQFFTLQPGTTTLELTEGKYSYYASTICGSNAGTWNLNVTKQLDITCMGSTPAVTLAKRCLHNWWGVLWNDSANGVTIYIEGDNIEPDEFYQLNNKLWYWLGYWPNWHHGSVVCWEDYRTESTYHLFDNVYFDYTQFK